MPTPTAAIAATSATKAITAIPAAAASRFSSASKNQRFHWFIATSTSNFRTRHPASPSVSVQAARAEAPVQNPPV